MGIFTNIMEAWARFTVALEDDDIDDLTDYFESLNEAKKLLILELNAVTEPSTWFWAQLMKRIDKPEGTITMLME